MLAWKYAFRELVKAALVTGTASITTGRTNPTISTSHFFCRDGDVPAVAQQQHRHTVL